METRIDQELALLRQRYPTLEYHAEGRWIKIPDYPLPAGWNRSKTDAALQIPPAYPGTPPYGIFVPHGLEFQGSQPENYTVSNETLPFPGPWGKLSWTTEDGLNCLP